MYLQVDMEKMRQRCYPFWVAPEVLQGGAPSTSSDVYALGLLIYELLYRQEPFNGVDPVVHPPPPPPQPPPFPLLCWLKPKGSLG